MFVSVSNKQTGCADEQTATNSCCPVSDVEYTLCPWCRPPGALVLSLPARRAGLLPEVPTEEERSSDGAGEVEVKMCPHGTHAHMLCVHRCFLTAPVPPEGIYCAS